MPVDADSSGDPQFGALYFDQLENRLASQNERYAKEFAWELQRAFNLCAIDFIDPIHFCTNSKQVSGFTMVLSDCSKRFDVSDRDAKVTLCENLIKRDADGAMLACARIVGRFAGDHSSYESAEIRMHFSDDGSWTYGHSPEELADIERRNTEDKIKREAGEMIPLATRSAASNLHCAKDITTFFEN